LLGVAILDEALARFAAGNGAVPVAGALAVHVADGDNLHAIIAEEAAHVVEALVAGADHAEVNALARRGLLVEAEGGGRYDQRRRDDGGPAKELAAREGRHGDTPASGAVRPCPQGGEACAEDARSIRAAGASRKVLRCLAACGLATSELAKPQAANISGLRA